MTDGQGRQWALMDGTVPEAASNDQAPDTDLPVTDPMSGQVVSASPALDNIRKYMGMSQGPKLQGGMTQAFDEAGEKLTGANPATQFIPGVSESDPNAPPAPPAGVGGGSVAAPSGAPPGTLELAGSSTTSSRSVQKGRDKAAVEGQIGSEAEAGKATDEARLKQATNADQRTQAELDTQIGGQKAIEERKRNEVIDNQLKQQAIDDAVGGLNKELEANDKSEDPDRYVRNMSTGKKIGMTILAALNGGFGALQGRKDNDVLNVINREIEQDISRQKDEIRRGTVRIGNKISEYMRKGHDLETATQLARDAADAAVDQVTQLQAKRLGVQGANADNASVISAAAQEQRAQRAGELRAQEEDKVSTSWQQTKTMQQKATGTVGSALDLQTKVQGMVTGMRKNGYSKEQIDEQLKKLGISAPSGDARDNTGKFNVDQSRLLAVNEDARSKLETIAKLRGFTYDAKTDSFVGSGTTNNLAPDWLSSQNAQLNAAAESIAPIVGLIQGGGQKAHTEEVHNIAAGLAAKSNIAALANLNSHWSALKSVIKGVGLYPGGHGAGATGGGIPEE